MINHGRWGPTTGISQEFNEWLVNGLHPTVKVGYIRVRTHLLAIY